MLNQNWAVILAAGNGTRLGASRPKQYIEWRSRPLFWHSALAMSHAGYVDGIVFVFPETHCEGMAEKIRELAFLDNLGLEWRIAAGGARRQDSARAGVEALPSACTRVLIHDAARCLLKPDLIRSVIMSISQERPVVVPAIPVTDTIRQVDPGNPHIAQGCIKRDSLRAIQTPQGFWLETLKSAYEQADSGDITDDAATLERLGYPVSLIAGDPANIKITNPIDLRMLGESDCGFPCSGFGYDVHRFGQGKPLKLGGVVIPAKLEVIAHSDGDVLLHALMDAMLGCASLGDIGRHFPDSDARFAGISSALLLEETRRLLREQDVELCHVDLTVVAQKPKLAPYADEIRHNVARLLALPLQAVNFKATTEEGLGFTGEMAGIKAYALVNGKRRAKSGGMA